MSHRTDAVEAVEAELKRIGVYDEGQGGVMEDAAPEKIESLRGTYPIWSSDAEHALVAAFRPFGSLTAPGAMPDEHERRLAKAVLAWVDERQLLEVAPLQPLLQILWATDADQLTMLGEVTPGSIELVTPTSRTRIRTTRRGRERTVEVKFGEAGSTQRAHAILAAAKALGVSFSEIRPITEI